MMAIERILVPVDFSRPSLRALDAAVEFSRPYDAQLIIMFVVEPGTYGSPLLVSDPEVLAEKQRRAAEGKLSQLERRLRKRDVNCRTLIQFGIAYQAIIETAKRVRADLIVIATHGRTGLAHALIGSVAERVVRTASCPVLTIRALAQPQRRADNRRRQSPGS